MLNEKNKTSVNNGIVPTIMITALIISVSMMADIKQCENDLVGLESNNSQLKLKLSQFGFDSNQNINSNLFNFHVDKLNQFCLQFTDNENKALTI